MIELSICIPTFNRSYFLQKCLKALVAEYKNLGQLRENIEILIFDNYSSDNTKKIVENYKKNFLNFKYKRNNHNIGSDKNFEQCFKKASGKYIFILCDDDQICNDGLKFVLSVIRENENKIGVIYLKTFSYNQKEFKPVPDFGTYKKLNSKNILKKLNLKLTFSSSLIIKNIRLSTKKFTGTSLIHFNYALEVMKIINLHVISSKYFVMAKRENSVEFDSVEGLDISKVFVENFLKGVKSFCNTSEEYKLLRKKLLYNYIIYKYAFVVKKKLNKERIKIFDKYFEDIFLYKKILRHQLLNIENPIYSFSLLTISFSHRVIDGEFFKIFNYFINNIKLPKILPRN